MLDSTSLGILVAGAGSAIGGLFGLYQFLENNKAQRAKNEAEARAKDFQLRMEQKRLQLEEREFNLKAYDTLNNAYLELNGVLRAQVSATEKRMEDRLKRHHDEYEEKISRLIESEKKCQGKLAEIEKKLNLK